MAHWHEHLTSQKVDAADLGQRGPWSKRTLVDYYRKKDIGQLLVKIVSKSGLNVDSIDSYLTIYRWQRVIEYLPMLIVNKMSK
jgi:hypothetical protein